MDTQVCNFLHPQKEMCNELENRYSIAGKCVSTPVIFAFPFVDLHLLLVDLHLLLEFTPVRDA